MYLVDTNIWLERLLDQERSAEVGQFLAQTPTGQLMMSDFTLHSIGIILDQLGKDFSGRVDFRAINTNEHPDLTRELKILSIPTLLVVDDKKEISRIIGAQSPENYQKLFSSLAAGEGSNTLPISSQDRILRLGAGGALATIAWMYAEWWLLPIGFLVIFLGIYDRCPIWQAITARFKKSL